MMARRLTVTVSDEVYDGLHRRVGRGRIGQFLDELARPHVIEPQGDDPGEQEMAEAYRSAAAEEAADPALARETRAWLGADFGVSRSS